MKLLSILREIKLENGKWESIPKDEIDFYKNKISDLINTAYSQIGGNLKMKSPADITPDKNYDVIDLDNDNDINAVSVTKDTHVGSKIVAIGHDGTSKAKKSILTRQIKELNNRGFYVEASGKLKDVFVRRGVEIVNDEEVVRIVLKGKNIEWVGDGTYFREIAGNRILKALLGKPRV
jgi:hypothetical protein